MSMKGVVCWYVLLFLIVATVTDASGVIRLHGTKASGKAIQDRSVANKHQSRNLNAQSAFARVLNAGGVAVNVVVDGQSWTPLGKTVTNYTDYTQFYELLENSYGFSISVEIFTENSTAPALAANINLNTSQYYTIVLTDNLSTIFVENLGILDYETASLRFFNLHGQDTVDLLTDGVVLPEFAQVPPLGASNQVFFSPGYVDFEFQIGDTVFGFGGGLELDLRSAVNYNFVLFSEQSEYYAILAPQNSLGCPVWSCAANCSANCNDLSDLNCSWLYCNPPSCDDVATLGCPVSSCGFECSRDCQNCSVADCGFECSQDCQNCSVADCGFECSRDCQDCAVTDCGFECSQDCQNCSVADCGFECSRDCQNCSVADCGFECSRDCHDCAVTDCGFTCQESCADCPYLMCAYSFDQDCLPKCPATQECDSCCPSADDLSGTWTGYETEGCDHEQYWTWKVSPNNERISVFWRYADSNGNTVTGSYTASPQFFASDRQRIDLHIISPPALKGQVAHGIYHLQSVLKGSRKLTVVLNNPDNPAIPTVFGPNTGDHYFILYQH